MHFKEFDSYQNLIIELTCNSLQPDLCVQISSQQGIPFLWLFGGTLRAASFQLQLSTTVNVYVNMFVHSEHLFCPSHAPYHNHILNQHMI